MPKSVMPKNIASIPLYTKRYEKFTGVDFSTDPTQVEDYRSPYAQNLISDLAGFPEKRLGWRTLHTVERPVNGLFYCVFASGSGKFLIHGGNKLYVLEDTPEQIYDAMANDRSTSFSHDGKLYILDGEHYLVCREQEDGLTVSTVAEDAETFIPTTLIGVPPAGGGTEFEAVNLLNSKRKNSFVGDALSHLYQLDAKELQSIDSVQVEEVEQTVAATEWKRGEEEGTCVSFIVPSVAESGNVFLKVSGREYSAVDAEGAAVAMSTLTAESRVSYLLTREQDTDGKYYLAKPFEYKEATEESTDEETGTVTEAAPTNCPTLTAERTDNIFTLSSKEYIKDLEKGTVEFAQPPQEYSGGSGIDNVVIQFSKSTEGYADRINRCSIFAFYGYNNDNRLFFAGNPDFQNQDWQSGLDDPTYFPDTGYTKIGSDTSAIMGYLKQYDSLTIVKSDNEQDAEIFLRTAEMTEDNKVLFPVKQGIKGVGAVSKYCFATLRDDPLFLAREGVFGIASTSVQMERNVQNRSFFVNTNLTAQSGLNNAAAVVWNGYYILCANNAAYVADSRQRTSTGEGSGYEWYYWTNIPARVFLEHDGDLFFGTEDGRVCRFNTDRDLMNRFSDDGEPIVARWSTRMDDFDWITKRKTLTKKGCGIMIKPYTRSSVKVYALTDRSSKTLIRQQNMDILSFADIDFGRFTFNTLDNPQVKAFNKKIKKFIVLQLIFENDAVNEGFGIYGVQVQFAIGGYVK